MAPVPAQPKIYHITHWQNLPGILASGVLWSDAKRIEMGLENTTIGISEIKRRRLEELAVSCHPGTRVGEYVPFYFCPRSIMLYILHMGNHPDLPYHGGQGPIIHLVADLHATVQWAASNGRRWAFSDRNAGTRYTNYFNHLNELHNVNWTAVASNDFRSAEVKDGKQAEFLAYESFPWELVESIGVANSSVQDSVNSILGTAAHRPPVTVQGAWYF